MLPAVNEGLHRDKTNGRRIPRLDLVRTEHPGDTLKEDTMQILDDLSTEVRQFLSNLRKLPITSPATPVEVRGFLEERYDFSRPTELGRVFRDVSEMLRRWNEHSNHPRHFGLFVPSIDVSSVVADALVALYNPQLAVWEMSPAGNEIEQHTLSRLAAAFGYDPGRAVYHFTTGGSEANLTAVVAALTDRFPRYGEDGLVREKLTPALYLSEEGHHSFVKAAHVGGIGRRAVRFVPAGDDLRMDLRALARQVDDDLERGFAPFMVVGTAGTTNAGVVDPLPELADFCRERGLWFHVDAAWGGAAVVSERLRSHLAGIERSDSITCDAHKLFSVPNGGGMFFCRRPPAVHRAFHVEAHYVPDQADDGRVYPFVSTLQWGRRMIGLKLFMTLAELGLPSVARRIEHQARMGDYLRRRLLARGWRLLNETPLPVVCFTHPRLGETGISTADVVKRVKSEQIGWISKTLLRGSTPALRASITSFHTREEDVDVLVDGLDRVLDEATALAAA